MAWAAVRSKAVVLLLLTCCLLLLPLWKSVIVLCFVVRYFVSIIAIIFIGKRELVVLFNLSSWCLVTAVWLFLAVPWVCLQFVIVVFPDHTHYFWCIHRTTHDPYGVTHMVLKALQNRREKKK